MLSVNLMVVTKQKYIVGKPNAVSRELKHPTTNMVILPQRKTVGEEKKELPNNWRSSYKKTVETTLPANNCYEYVNLEEE